MKIKSLLFFVLFGIIALPLQSFADCQPGEGVKGEGCEVCPVGTYSTGGNKECTFCEAGKFTDKQGQSQCTDCYAGNFCPGNNPNRNEEAIKAYFGKETVSEEEINSIKGQMFPCPNGWWMTSERQQYCKTCGAGYYVLNNVCNKCKEGSFCPGDNPNKDNETIKAYLTLTLNGSKEYNKYDFQGQIFECPKGWYQNNKTSSSCVVCNSGKYATKDVNGVNCNVCAEGSFCPGDNPNKDNETIKAYLNGSDYNRYDFKGQQLECPAGWVSKTGQSGCAKCGPGQYKQDSQTCANCHKGHFCLGASPSVSDLNKNTIKAHLGKGNNDELQDGDLKDLKGKMLECPKGFYQAAEGKQYCDSCDTGVSTYGTGSKEKTDCSVRNFSNNKFSICGSPTQTLDFLTKQETDREVSLSSSINWNVFLQKDDNQTNSICNQ